MNAIDLFILGLLLLGGLNGLRQGFVKAIANLIGWIFALILAAKFATPVAPIMSVLSTDPVVQKITAFIFIVFFVVMLTWIISAILNKVLTTLKLGPLNRLAGGAFGALKSIFVLLILVQGLSYWVSSSPHWKESKFITTLSPYAPWATSLSKEFAYDAIQHVQSDDLKNPVNQSSESSKAQASADSNPSFY